MKTIMKDGIKVVMPDYDAVSKRNMMRAAEFMARMVQKYGKEVLAEIEAEEKAKAAEQNTTLRGADANGE